MEARSLEYIAEACGGELTGDRELAVSRVCTDSRQARSSDLFVALRGDRFDGHQFAAAAARQGAAALMVDRANLGQVTADLRQAGLCDTTARVAVDDTRAALGRLAARYRGDFRLPIFAVGGSNGKTTTKELLAALLRQRYATLWSEASFNNAIGVPLTLLRLEAVHAAAVLEVGTNHPGELAPLVRMIRPRYGLITNLGPEHLEFFGDLKGVAAEEGWLAELLPESGKLFLNGDTAGAGDLLRRGRAPVVQTGLGGHNDWRARNVRLDDRGVSFTVEAPAPEWSGEYRVNLLGRHQASNALLALAAGAEAGLTREELAAGLAVCQPLSRRMQMDEAGGARILDDTYNANADSMLAALETLAQLSCGGRRIAVLGDMAELGVHAEAAHRQAGRRAAELRLDALYTVGRLAGATAAAARAAGLLEVREFAEAAEAAAALRRELKRDDLVLLKASRASRLERIGAALREGTVTQAGTDGRGGEPENRTI